MSLTRKCVRLLGMNTNEPHADKNYPGFDTGYAFRLHHCTEKRSRARQGSRRIGRLEVKKVDIDLLLPEVDKRHLDAQLSLIGSI